MIIDYNHNIITILNDILSGTYNALFKENIYISNASRKNIIINRKYYS